jgi:hypothetical protein
MGKKKNSTTNLEKFLKREEARAKENLDLIKQRLEELGNKVFKDSKDKKP